MIIEGITMVGILLIIVEELIGHGGAWLLEHTDRGNGVIIKADFVWGIPFPVGFHVYPQ